MTKLDRNTRPVFCPHCGKPLDVQIQEYPPRYKLATSLLCTCWEDGCALKDYTMDPPMLTDLAELAKRHAEYRFDVLSGSAVTA